MTAHQLMIVLYAIGTGAVVFAQATMARSARGRGTFRICVAIVSAYAILCMVLWPAMLAGSQPPESLRWVLYAYPTALPLVALCGFWVRSPARASGKQTNYPAHRRSWGYRIAKGRRTLTNTMRGLRP